MGIFSILGDVAKGFAEGYIEERGIQGTMEDVSDFASNFAKNFKEGAAEYDEEEAMKRWNALVEKLKISIGEQKYEKALSQLGNYYRQFENNEKDFWYYSYRAYIYVSWLDELPYDDSQIGNFCSLIRNSIKDARRLADCQEFIDDITDTENRFNEVVERINNTQAYYEQWGKTVDKINSYLEVGNYNQAENTLEDHYAKYEEGLDIHYYLKMLEIRVALLDSYETIDKCKVERSIDNLISAAKEKTDDETCLDRLNDLINKYEEIKSKYNNISNIVESLLEEKSVPSAYSDSELEYMEEYKTCLADDGTITEKERRLLMKLSKSLGINENRVKELENECLSPIYTQEEQEYLAEYKDCLDSDGFVSDKERRLLDKIRDTLGISIARAHEIEESVVSNRS